MGNLLRWSLSWKYCPRRVHTRECQALANVLLSDSQACEASLGAHKLLLWLYFQPAISFGNPQQASGGQLLANSCRTVDGDRQVDGHISYA